MRLKADSDLMGTVRLCAADSIPSWRMRRALTMFDGAPIWPFSGPGDQAFFPGKVTARHPRNIRLSEPPATENHQRYDRPAGVTRLQRRGGGIPAEEQCRKRRLISYGK